MAVGNHCFQNVFRPQGYEKSAFQIFRFEGRFRDGLVWTVGLTAEITLCFKISPAYCGLWRDNFGVTPHAIHLNRCG